MTRFCSFVLSHNPTPTASQADALDPQPSVSGDRTASEGAPPPSGRRGRSTTPGGGGAAASGGGPPADELDDATLLARLREYLESRGGAWADGWSVGKKQRGSGASAGTMDIYYFNPAGRRFRSRQEAAKSMGLDVGGGGSGGGGGALKRPARGEAAASAAAWAAGVAAPALPIDLGAGVRLVALGAADRRPAYSSPTTVWPVGLTTRVADPAAGTYVCVVEDGGEGGPAFSITLHPLPAAAEGGPPRPLPVARARDPETAWAAASLLQIDALKRAAAANRRLIETMKAAGGGGGGGGSGRGASPAPSSGPPSEAGDDDAGGAAPAAAASPPPPPTASDPALDRLLVDAAPLEGVWGLERFGMASSLTRRLVEGLAGLADACPDYRFLEQRGGSWAEEERRLASDRSRKRAKPAAAYNRV